MIPCQFMNNQVSIESKVQNLVQILKKGVVVLAAALLLGAGWIAYKNYSDSKAEQSFSELFKAEKLEELAEREASALNKTAIDIMKTWPQTQKEEYESKLLVVTEKFPQTAAAALAGLKLGRWYLENQENSKAEELFKKLLSQFKASQDLDRNLYRALISEGLGLAYENAEKWSDAESLYKEVVEIKENPLRPLSMLGLARAQRKLNKVDEAKGTYEKLAVDFPDTSYEKKARALKAQL